MTRPAIHPGEQLRVDLEEIGMSQAQLARILHVPKNRISQIVNGERGITADTALRLAQWMGTSPRYWLSLQALYDLRRAEQEHGDEIRNTITLRDQIAA